MVDLRGATMWSYKMKTVEQFMYKIEDSVLFQAIRQGLISTIPLLMIGSFALVFNIFPIAPYQDYLTSDAGAWLSTFFVGVNQAAFGILGLASAISVSISFARFYTNQSAVVIGAVFSSLSSYAIFINLFSEDFLITSFGAQGMFTALVCATGGAALYCWLYRKKVFQLRNFYTVGADINFNTAVSIIGPVAIVTVFAYLINTGITFAFDVNGFEGLFNLGLSNLFNLFEDNSLKAFLYVFLADFLWFFGIHGTNVLNGVEQNLFLVDGVVSTIGFGYLNKPVIDLFVFMGGAGATASLLVAILLFSKRKNVRSLGKMAALPMWFNVNELVVFGLPIVLNPSFFIPFLLVPLVNIVISVCAIAFGIVPEPTVAVSWAMPLFINAYEATGSFMGVVLQVVNIAVGALIYRWFLLRYDRRSNLRVKKNLDDLVKKLKESEESGEPLILMDQTGNAGSLVKMLAADLAYEIKNPETFEIFYQPQYDNNDKCVSAEGLLRWHHPLCGIIYPPLVIGLATETGLLSQLERTVFRNACKDLRVMRENNTDIDVISVNVTAATLQGEGFVEFLTELRQEYPEIKDSMCIELTENMSFLIDERTEERFAIIRNMGFTFAIDDFSMGRTSVKYLQSNLFDYVKLDGSLVLGMMSNDRSLDIISSIIKMGETMNFQIIAEYVETKDQRDLLRSLGCDYYQGWYYYPAVPITEFIDRVMKDQKESEEA